MLKECSTQDYWVEKRVTILLSLTMLLQTVADRLPRTSDAIPIIGDNWEFLNGAIQLAKCPRSLGSSPTPCQVLVVSARLGDKRKTCRLRRVGCTSAGRSHTGHCCLDVCMVGKYAHFRGMSSHLAPVCRTGLRHICRVVHSFLLVNLIHLISELQAFLESSASHELSNHVLGGAFASAGC
ncbi:unnamed protein product [Protopolystoma xenopodis]|uniref:Uncharacterized protein n=1 Tax=Protopolystoma xenopodis TaxID=117903 RepID=A0A3S5A0T3_9PLAT|nr:unnamed protein product [Protopolystoma xenopodis]